MTQRPIKFRAWDGKYWYQFNLVSLAFGLPSLQRLLTESKPPIMQFTGLLDKNGKEIYEGDVIKTEFGSETKEVVFWEGCFCNKWDDGRGHIFNPKKVEIVGNIYENAGLLKI